MSYKNGQSDWAWSLLAGIIGAFFTLVLLEMVGCSMRRDHIDCDKYPEICDEEVNDKYYKIKNPHPGYYRYHRYNKQLQQSLEQTRKERGN